MEFTRNHYFFAGMIILLLGINLRVIDSFVLNEKSTEILAKKAKQEAAPTLSLNSFFPSAVVPPPRHVVRPPRFIGWVMISVGGVLVLHSLALKRPGGQ
jgi:hypothetical protein